MIDMVEINRVKKLMNDVARMRRESDFPLCSCGTATGDVCTSCRTSVCSGCSTEFEDGEKLCAMCSDGYNWLDRKDD
jgi:hypothetical protein